MAQLTLQQAIDTLNDCTRTRQRNKVFWRKDGRIVAEGTKSGGKLRVLFEGETVFDEEDAHAIWFAGTRPTDPYKIEREMDSAPERLTLRDAAAELGLGIPLQLA